MISWSVAWTYATKYLKSSSFGALSVVDTLLNRQKLIRRGLVAWVAYLITYVTNQIFDQPFEHLNGYVVTMYGMVTGLSGAVLHFYFNSRKDEDDADPVNH